MSGAAQAHDASEVAHEVSHAVAPVLDSQSSGDSSAPEAADVGHAEACGQNHCGHSHTLGMLPADGSRTVDPTTSAALSAMQTWANSALPNNIERPKWSHTTPAVVNL